ncbi:MAG: hypothetical protein OFPII_36910 [Osedax symbiont Rs1]|nr:MAG: hypothetical protein OFPII_36910 [Osedax symbiont Rs1]
MDEIVEKSLCSSVRMLCKGLKGQSASLDENLSTLLAHMMNSEEPFSDQLMTCIQQDIHVLELEKQENNQDFLNIGASWQRSLNKLDLDPEQKQKLQDVAGGLQDLSTSHLYQLPAKFQQLLEIQLEVAGTTVSNASSNQSQSLAIKSIADEIILLLRQITPSKKSSASYLYLIAQLERDIDINKLPEVIVKLAEFVESALAVKNEGFSAYLHELNKHLSDVQSFISKTQHVEDEDAKARNEADTQVRNSVSNIRASVTKATDLNSLQSLLTLQLNQIVGAMDAMKNGELKRESHLQSSYNTLKQRVSVMEKEAEKVHFYIAEERKQARQDALTGLPNRTAYNEIMAHQIESFKRYKQPLSLVVCDLDHFKTVNDSYGHLAGDKVLSLVAKILLKGTRTSDFVTRYGGEEFAIILPSTKVASVVQAMNKIRSLICKSPFNYKGTPIPISMSFGVCEAQPGDSIETLFARADAALYRAKEAGRNKVEMV